MTTPTSESASPLKKSKRRLMLLSLASIFTLILLIWLIYWLIWGQFEEYTDDAYINGNIIQVMSQVPGTVIKVNADNTQYISEGQVIIKLDSADSNIELERAESSLASTVRQVRQSFESTATAEATVALRNADLLKTQLDLNRRQALLPKHLVSQEEVQHYSTDEKIAESQYNIALHNYRSTMALVENSHVYDHPMVNQAKANYRYAYLNQLRTSILAPVSGYIAERSVQVGQEIGKNTPLLAIIPLNQIWVEANLKESQLSNVHQNQNVTLSADSYPGVIYHGKVLGISPGTGANFSLLPPQNATGNWIKIVQRVPVRILLDPEEIKKNPLLIGLSMRVTIDTSNRKGPRLATLNSTQPSYTTSIYQNQLNAVNNKIETILKENSPNLFIPRSSISPEHP